MNRPFVIVNGRVTLQDGQPTGDLAGQLLRSSAADPLPYP